MVLDDIEAFLNTSLRYQRLRQADFGLNTFVMVNPGPQPYAILNANVLERTWFEILDVPGTPGRNDMMIGGNAGDILYAGAGDDLVMGNNGTDNLRGASGNDILLGGRGRDYLDGEDGDDVLMGDTVLALSRQPTLTLSPVEYFQTVAGSDLVSPRPRGADLVLFEPNDVGFNDSLFGGNGNDRMFGGLGADLMYGGEGTDFLDSGPRGWRDNRDVMTGGAGGDVFFLSSSQNSSVGQVTGQFFVDLLNDSVSTPLNSAAYQGIVDAIEATFGQMGLGSKIATGLLGTVVGGAVGAVLAAIVDVVISVIEASLPSSEDTSFVTDFDPREDLLLIPLGLLGAQDVTVRVEGGITRILPDGTGTNVLSQAIIVEQRTAEGEVFRVATVFLSDTFMADIGIDNPNGADARAILQNALQAATLFDRNGYGTAFSETTGLGQTATGETQVMMVGAAGPMVWNASEADASLLVSGTNESDFLDANRGFVRPGGEVTDAASNSLVRVENFVIYGFDGDDQLTGNNGTNRLYGGLGQDTLRAMGNAAGAFEIMDGGAGDDVIQSSQFRDNALVFGGAGIDRVSFAFEREDAVDLTQGAQTGVHLVTRSIGGVLSVVSDSVLLDVAGQDRFQISGVEIFEGSAFGDDFSLTVAAETAFGGAGNDILDGGGGNDRIFGGNDDDLLIGSLGSDILIGGAGNDTLFAGFDPGRSSGVVPVDNRADTASGGDGDDVLVRFAGDTGAADFQGGGGNDLLEGGLGHDTLSGGDGNDRLFASAGDDTLVGGDGADTLQGEQGLDRLFGGAGNDVLSDLSGSTEVDGGLGNDLTQLGFGNGELHRVRGGSGDDRLILTGVSLDDLQFRSLAGYSSLEVSGPGGSLAIIAMREGSGVLPFTEVLQLDDIAVRLGQSLVGAETHALAELIAGTAAGDEVFGRGGRDILFGAGGSDTLVGGLGDDTLRGGSGDDAMFGEALESPAVTTGNNALFGDSGNDLLRSGAGNDLLEGGTGDDNLASGAGDDTLAGGAGNDTLNGGDGTDLVSFSGVAGDGVTADLSVATVQNTGHGLDLILGVENIRGSGQNDSLGGSNGVNRLWGEGGDDRLSGRAGNDDLDGGTGDDTLDGGAGADTLRGGAGDDVYIVDSSGDAVIETPASGFDLVQSSISFSLDGLLHVEAVELTGTANLSATGNGLRNLVAGNQGNNRLDGGAGIDTMIGGAGNDIYVVDSSSDVVAEALSLFGPPVDPGGIDRVESSVTYSLDSVRFVESLTLTGSGNASGSGNILANRLTGNAGNNTLNGGLGNDTLTGGAGRDAFVFSSAPGAGNVDRITDFVVTDDTIRLDDAVFGGLARGTLAASALAVNLSGTASDALDRILYETDTGRLFFDADGSGAGARIHFATLGPNLALTNADFVVF